MAHLVCKWVAPGRRAVKSKGKEQERKSKRAKAEDNMVGRRWEP